MEPPTSPMKDLKLVAYTDFKIVDMVIFRDELVVATEHGVYRLVRGTFEPIKFQPPEPA